MGRLWQTLILRNWRPILAYLPVETVIRTRQDDYYHSLRRSDKMGNSTVFIEFMLNAVLDSLREAISSDQVSDQVKKLLRIFSGDSIAGSELMRILNLSHKPTFRMNYLRPAISQGFIEMTIPDRPNSRMQKYRLTHKGRTFIGK